MQSQLHVRDGLRRREGRARGGARLYRLAADQGYAFAQSNLGIMYEQGRGAAKDEREAVRLYRLAAEQGNAIAAREAKRLSEKLGET